MQAVATQQIGPANPEIPLQALSSAGKALPELPSTPLAEYLEYLGLDSESYDSVLHTATESRFIKVEPATNLPLRARVRTILSNKIARLTLKIAFWMAVVTTIYYGTSLVPAFQGSVAATRGLQIQIESESDSRQTVAYGFLQECGNRNNANLPLGPDCIKYLSKTPKAPHDIDNWMIDIPESNSTRLSLVVRGLELTKQEVQQNHTVSSTSTSTVEDWTLNWWNIAFWVMVLWTTLTIVFTVFPILLRTTTRNPHMLSVVLGFFPFLRRMSERYPKSGLFSDRLDYPEGLPPSRFKLRRFLSFFSILGIWVLFWGSWTVILFHLYKQRRWTAASDFLATCRMHQENNFPLGDDCAKYVGKDLKPSPALSPSAKMVIGVGIGLGLPATFLFMLVMFSTRLPSQREPRLPSLPLS